MEEEAQNRQRVIFVEDGAQWFDQLYISEDGPEDIRIEEAKKRVLAKFAEPLVATDVEAVVYRLDQGNHYLFYNTQVGECIGDAVELLEGLPFPPRSNQIYSASGTRGLWHQAENFRRFREVGFDPFHALIERLHEVGKQAFLKIRLNDAHVNYFWFDLGGSRARATRFQLSHPEYMLGYRDQNRAPGPPCSLVMDFARQEVRAQRLAVIEEIGQRYDLDGLELNFCRTLHLFKEGEVEEGRELMTGFMRQVKAALDRIGRQRGRPIKVIARFHVRHQLPNADPMEYEEGVDILRWMQEGLVDLAVPVVPVGSVEGGYYVQQYIQAARGTPCEVFVGIRNANHDDMGYGPITREVLRAALCSYARTGADGVYVWWPRIDPEHANWGMLREGRDPAAMARGDKHYIVSRTLPLALQLGQNKVLFEVADDLAAAAAEDALEEVRLRLRILHLGTGDKLHFALNGRPLPPEALIPPAYPSIQYVFGCLTLRLAGDPLPVQGENELTIAVRARDPEAAARRKDCRDLLLDNLEVLIRYRSAPLKKEVRA